jgi:hypothetical protein
MVARTRSGKDNLLVSFTRGNGTVMANQQQAADPREALKQAFAILLWLDELEAGDALTVTHDPGAVPPLR